MSHREKMPSHQTIADHHTWWGVECFACGYPPSDRKRLDRAHVIPHALGGSDTDPGNYVLLCKSCHRESPDVADKRALWGWVLHRRSNSGQPSWEELLAEMTKYGLPPQPEMDWAMGWLEDHPDLMHSLVHIVGLDLTTQHFGVPRPPLPTKAWLVWRIIQYALAQYDATTAELPVPAEFDAINVTSTIDANFPTADDAAAEWDADASHRGTARAAHRYLVRYGRLFWE